MKEKPILFSGDMVRAILEGTKTQSRRIVKPQPDIAVPGPIPGSGVCGRFTPEDEKFGRLGKTIPCPYGHPGDRLWVRETWAMAHGLPPESHLRHQVLYAADYAPGMLGCPARPSIHMHRWASRITLEITGVRLERLQEISDADALAEGCSAADMKSGDCLASVYARLWDQINGPGSWAANPWVWVIEFKRLSVAGLGKQIGEIG